MYGLFSGSSTVVAGCGGFGSANPAAFMTEGSCIRRRRRAATEFWIGELN